LGGESKGNGNSGEETFGYICDDDTNGEDQVGNNSVFVNDSENEEDDSKSKSDS
jgi:hypothetical protein